MNKLDIGTYRGLRRMQRSLRGYGLTQIEFDVLVELYEKGDWISYRELRKRSGIRTVGDLGMRGAMPLITKDYAEAKRNLDNSKDVRITQGGKTLVEKILES